MQEIPLDPAKELSSPFVSWKLFKIQNWLFPVEVAFPSDWAGEIHHFVAYETFSLSWHPLQPPASSVSLPTNPLSFPLLPFLSLVPIPCSKQEKIAVLTFYGWLKESLIP